MNNIFEKNINTLALKNPKLAEKLTKHIFNEIPQLIKENNFYNLVYKNHYLHNEQNPLEEAKEIFSRCENTPVTIHMIYGIGLGYLFQYTSANSIGSIILFEPDLNILKIAFTLVDFSNDIIKKNVYITDNIEQAGEYLHKNSNTQNTPLLLTTKSYLDMNKNGFKDLVKTLQTMVGRYNLDRKYTKERFYSLLKNTINNMPNLVNDIPLLKIKNIYKDKTAVVVSAGPTLDRNIETMKKYRDRFVLIVVGTAMKTMAKHGLIPDFLCMIEAYDSSKQISDLDLSNVNFVTEPYSNPKFRNFKFKQTYTHISNNLPVNSFWSNMIGESTNEYFTKGTVSYTALNVARILGCNKIILVGQDLAYIEGQCYSKDSAYKDLICSYNKTEEKWEITAKDFDNFADSLSNSPNKEERINSAKRRLQALNKSLYYVKGIKGDDIPTESVYAAFIAPLSEFTQRFKDIEYINTSLVGAEINGFKNIPLEIALESSAHIERKEITTDFKIDKNDIKNKLQREKEILLSAKKAAQEGQASVKSFKNYLNRYKNVTEEVLKELKKVTAIFLKISTLYQDTIFDYITASERMDIDYAMKMTKKFDYVILKDMESKMSAYFNNAETKISEILTLLNNVGEKF